MLPLRWFLPPDRLLHTFRLNAGLPSSAAEALDREYRVPESITRGKDHVTVKFQAQDETIAGALIELRTVR